MDREERNVKTRGVALEVATLVHDRCIELGLSTDDGLAALIDTVVAIAMAHRTRSEADITAALVKLLTETARRPRSKMPIA